MEHKYSHILTPVRIGKHVLKNRLINSKCIPEGIQGPENFPAESHINFAANLAKNGAAIVTLAPGNYKVNKVKSTFTSPFNMDDRYVSRYYRRMIDRIHAYGSLASASTMTYFPGDVAISDIRNEDLLPESVRNLGGPESLKGRDGKYLPEITKEGIEQMKTSVVKVCKKLQSCGFDMINVYMSYNASLMAKSLSPILNQRVDEYGGSLENRARLAKELFGAIKEACGKDFLIEVQISGREQIEGGYTTEDLIEYAKIWEGLVDIYQVRAWTGDMTHASHYTSPKENPTNLKFAAAMKAAGVPALVAPVGGFQDPDLIESFLAEGKCDLVAMARPFICDPNYGLKILEGRGEDVTPCIHCDNCHQAFCSVNPEVGLAHVWSDMFDEPRCSKKVAVVGGGPAGMKAAFTAAERGHKVTLYEAAPVLGGQLIHADYIDKKWAIHDLKEYLIRQCEKNGVEIKLNTKATAEMLEKEGYDAVIAACGAVPKSSPIHADEGVKVWAPMEVFGNEAQLGKKVAIVGGAMAAVDTALYLTAAGHEVTMLTRSGVAHDCNSHATGAIKETIRATPGLSIIENAETTYIGAGQLKATVTTGGPMGGMMPMMDPDDMPDMPDDMGPMPMMGGPGPMEPPKKEDITVDFDSVVVSAGRRALVGECYEFAAVAPEFAIVGDSNMLSFENLQHGGAAENDDTANGTIRHSMFTAYTAALKL